jgi:hypothetical protein
MFLKEKAMNGFVLCTNIEIRFYKGFSNNLKDIKIFISR